MSSWLKIYISLQSAANQFDVKKKWTQLIFAKVSPLMFLDIQCLCRWKWMVYISVVDSKMFAGKVLIAPDVASFLQLFCLETTLCRCSTTCRSEYCTPTLHLHPSQLRKVVGMSTKIITCTIKYSTPSAHEQMYIFLPFTIINLKPQNKKQHLIWDL